MDKRKKLLALLTAGFVLAEIAFSFFTETFGTPAMLDDLVIMAFFLIFIVVYARGVVWIKWILSVLLILYGLLCFVVGLDLGIPFFLIGLYFLFFGIFIHLSKVLRIQPEPKPIRTVVNDPQKFELLGEVYEFPLLVSRYKAIFIDGIILMTVLIIVMMMVEGSELQTPIMVSVGLTLLATYEPILTCYSSTIGQRLMKIKVVSFDNPEERINILEAYIRWFTKFLLGWLSFITINFNPEHRAIHDITGNSVMIVSK